MDSSGEDQLGYRTGAALWEAVNSRIRRRVKEDRTLNIISLQRQFVYDRFLARVFATGSDDWVLKGGNALLVRVRSARHSQDLDLFRRAGTVELALDELTKAAAIDLHDHFRFELALRDVRTARSGQPNTALAIVHVDGYVGVSKVAQFTVDVVTGSIITAPPERTMPTTVVDIDGLVTPEYNLYPMVDHIADKLCATVEVHPPTGRPSSRDRDLVDLVVIARTQSVDVSMLRAAIEAERLHRHLSPITAYATPPGWRTTYARLASNVAECREHRSYDDAVALVGAFLDPVLSGSVLAGRWLPQTQIWSS